MAFTGNISSANGFESAAVDFYIRKELLSFGEFSLLYRRFANKEKIPAGNGKNWKALRYTRLPLPMAGLTEGETPADTLMTIENVTATATQYGMVVTISDVTELTIDHPVLNKAIELVKDAMQRLDEELICEALLAGTSVKYSGTSNAARADLAAGDILTTTDIRLAVAQLEFSDDVYGAAPRDGMYYKSIINRKCELDLMADSTWKDYAIRLNGADLEKGMINRWAGVEFFSTNFGPKLVNIGDPTLSDNVAVTGTVGLDGAIFNPQSGTGALVASTAYDFKIVRRHKHRRFPEGISGVLDISTGVSEENIVVTFPTSTAYVYDLYAGADAGVLYRVAANQAALSTFDVAAIPTSGVVAPAHPVASINVYTNFVFGKDAYAVVDLDTLDAGVTEAARTDSDPLKQRRRVGAKFMEGALILSDNNIVRIESVSAY